MWSVPRRRTERLTNQVSELWGRQRHGPQRATPSARNAPRRLACRVICVRHRRVGYTATRWAHRLHQSPPLHPAGPVLTGAWLPDTGGCQDASGVALAGACSAFYGSPHLTPPRRHSRPQQPAVVRVNARSANPSTRPITTMAFATCLRGAPCHSSGIDGTSPPRLLRYWDTSLGPTCGPVACRGSSA